MSTEPHSTPTTAPRPTEAEVARWRRIETWLDRLLDLPEPEQAAALQALAQRDPALVDEVTRLLALAKEDTPLLQRAALEILESTHYAAAAAHSDEPPELVAGMVIGPYALIRELGHGGMGAVWLARRVDGQLEREVALKLPHNWLMASMQRSRFLQERNILAALNHPHIATLYEAGVATVAGIERPWLALEYVEGQRIDRWCNERKASVRQRIALMLQVMTAVQYAHSRLVIHRDLKPANILVTPEGSVKLLDFGIAKLISEEGDAAPDGATIRPSALTQQMGQAVTPDYASPEQLLSEPITTATDVYALGMVLYELLCGKRPYPDQGKNLIERLKITRTLARESPPLASSRIVSDSDAANFGINVKTLRTQLRGDLDAVLNKAMAWDPQARYRSVEAMQRDLERQQNDLPVSAHRISRLALLGKFIRRHRLGVSFATALLLAVGLGTAGVAWQAQRAEAQAKRAEKTKEFLVSLFRTVDPRIASDTPHAQLTMKAVLDRNSDRIESEFRDDPAMQIELLGIVSDLYGRIGDTTHYERLRNRYLTLAKQQLGPLSEPVLQDAVVQAWDRCFKALPDCDALQSQANDLLNAADQKENGEQRAQWWSVEWRRLNRNSDTAEQARTYLQKAVDYYAAQGKPSRHYVTALANSGNDWHNRGDWGKASEYFEQALRLSRQLPQPDDSEQITIYANLGLAQQQLGNYLKAAEAYDKAGQISVQTDGVDDEDAWLVLSKSARLRHLAGDLTGGRQEYARVIALLPASGEAVFRETSEVISNLADSLTREGRGALAVTILEPLEQFYRYRTIDPFSLRYTRSNLGVAYALAGRQDDARRVFHQALEEYIRLEPATSQALLQTRERWGRFLLDRGEVPAAAEQFQAILNHAEGRKLSHVALAQAGLARAALLQGDKSAALEHSDAAMKLWGEKTGFYDIRMQPYIQRVRADALAVNGELETAQKLEDEAWRASQQYDAHESPTTRRRILQP